MDRRARPRSRRPLGEAGGRSDGRRVEPDAALLEVDRVTKSFGELHAVDAASFTVEDHTITALIGPNGSGKTTVFNMITGYLGPTPAGSCSTVATSPARPAAACTVAD